MANKKAEPINNKKPTMMWFLKTQLSIVSWGVSIRLSTFSVEKKASNDLVISLNLSGENVISKHKKAPTRHQSTKNHRVTSINITTNNSFVSVDGLITIEINLD